MTQERPNHRIGIDLIRFLRVLNQDRKQTLLYCFVGAIIGLSIAFGSPKIYKSSVMLAPEGSSSNLKSFITCINGRHEYEPR